MNRILFIMVSLYLTLQVSNGVYTNGQFLSEEAANTTNPVLNWVEQRESTSLGWIVTPFAWAGKLVGYFASWWHIIILDVPLMNTSPFNHLSIILRPFSAIAVATIIFTVIGILRRTTG